MQKRRAAPRLQAEWVLPTVQNLPGVVVLDEAYVLGLELVLAT